MDFKKTLEQLKREIDKELQKYLLQAVKDAKKEDKEIGRMLEHLQKMIMAGGKRIRPILMYFGYVAAGGKDKKKIIKASVGVELLHMFFLVHDDIMDCGRTRHGVETIDVFYEEINKKFFNDCKNRRHFGTSMSIMAGDLLEALSIQAIFKAGFDEKSTARAVSALQVTIATTIIGQIQDICIENKKLTSEKEVLAMYKNKTAKYTLENPLKVGAILAGANEKFLEKISSAAIPIGMAFQIQDDILGLFETSKKMGKDSGSDIKEGKKTLLVLEALKKSEKGSLKFMQKILGNKKANSKDINKFKNIIQKTGALKYNQALAKKLVQEGKTKIEAIKMDKEAKKFLLEFAAYMIARNI